MSQGSRNDTYKGLVSEHWHGAHQNVPVSSLGAFLHFAQPIYHHLFSWGMDVMVTVHLYPCFCDKHKSLKGSVEPL